MNVEAIVTHVKTLVNNVENFPLQGTPDFHERNWISLYLSGI